MKKLGASIVYWKLAIAKASGKSLMAGVMSMAATLNGVQWHEFTGTQKFVAIATAAASMWIVLDAFLDQTMSRLSAGELKQIANETGGA